MHEKYRCVASAFTFLASAYIEAASVFAIRFYFIHESAAVVPNGLPPFLLPRNHVSKDEIEFMNHRALPVCLRASQGLDPRLLCANGYAPSSPHRSRS
jgi:hypothetical protein